MNFSFEVLKQFVITRIIPPLAGALATWITVKLHFLSIFHFGQDETAKALAEIGVFLVTVVTAWASAHFSLKGHYLPSKVDTDRRS